MAEDRKRRKASGSESPEEDRALWRKVAQTAKPLAKRDARKTAVEPAPEAAETKGEPARPKTPRGQGTVPRRAQADKAKPLPRLSSGAAADVDRRTADRLKRGKLPIERRLDLHGMTQAEAQRALAEFIAASQASGRRCLLVITGKGSGREGGILRQSLPGWLNEPGNRARLVAFTPAQPQHGGHGAMYLLLKRPRE